MLFTFPCKAEEVTAHIPSFKVTLNMEEIDNEYREYPLLVYKDITYVPMTYHDCRYLSLLTTWDDATNTLTIDKSGVVCAYRDYKGTQKNSRKVFPKICDFNIVVNGKEIDNSKEEYPLLTFRDVTYFPLTWRFSVEEFGWENSFGITKGCEEGLKISSLNYKSESIELPDLSGTVATDGKYYYYSGLSGERRVIYRLPVSSEGEREIIFEFPQYTYSNTANFFEYEKEIYFSCLFSRMKYTYYKIEKDGRVVEKKPDYYSFESLPENMSIGRKRNGTNIIRDSSSENCIKVYKGKVYYTAVKQGEEDSALYVFDEKTGEHKRIIDGVCGFHVYTGWYNEKECDSTMILYDNNGTLMRYTEIDGKKITLEEECDRNLILENAVGSNNIYAVKKTISGDKTIVKEFDCYASGYGSRTGTLFETQTGTYNKVCDGKLCVMANGENENDTIRTLVLGENVRFLSSDAVNSFGRYGYPTLIFTYDDILLYNLEDKIIKVVLK